MTENDLLFLDTETDNLWKLGFDERHPGQPRPVQLAFARYSPSGHEVFASSVLIQPLPSWPELTQESISIHGIQEATRRGGVQPNLAADLLIEGLHGALAVGGHNVGFDILVLRAFLFDLGLPEIAERLLTMKSVDTMQMGVEVCQLPRRDGEPGYKRPSLTELHTHLFGTGFDGAHDALVDVRASARSYFEMKRRFQTPDAEAVLPRTDGGRDIEEVRRVIQLCQTAPKESAREEDVVRDYTARFEKYGDRFLASDKVWSWLCRIANRANTAISS